MDSRAVAIFNELTVTSLQDKLDALNTPGTEAQNADNRSRQIIDLVQVLATEVNCTPVAFVENWRNYSSKLNQLLRLTPGQSVDAHSKLCLISGIYQKFIEAGILLLEPLQTLDTQQLNERLQQLAHSQCPPAAYNDNLAQSVLEFVAAMGKVVQREPESTHLKQQLAGCDEEILDKLDLMQQIYQKLCVSSNKPEDRGVREFFALLKEIKNQREFKEMDQVIKALITELDELQKIKGDVFEITQARSVLERYQTKLQAADFKGQTKADFKNEFRQDWLRIKEWLENAALGEQKNAGLSGEAVVAIWKKITCLIAKLNALLFRENHPSQLFFRKPCPEEGGIELEEVHDETVKRPAFGA